MANYADLMAEIHAELGQADEKARMLALMSRYLKATTGDSVDPALKAAAFLRADISKLWIAAVAGDPSATLTAAAALIERSKALNEKTGGKNPSVLGSHATALQLDAGLALANADYDRAEASSRSALEMALKLDAQSWLAELRAAHALALARLGRLPEARALLALALDEQRAKIAAGSDDQWLRIELAQSLYALAWTRPNGGAKELKEAAALLDALPAAMQPYRTVRLWRERIAQGTNVASAPSLGAITAPAAK